MSRVVFFDFFDFFFISLTRARKHGEILRTSLFPRAGLARWAVAVNTARADIRLSLRRDAKGGASIAPPRRLFSVTPPRLERVH